MDERLMKFYGIHETDDNSYYIFWALNTKEIHLDGRLKIEQGHEYYPFVRWAHKNPPKFAAMAPESVLEELCKVFSELEEPTWDTLMERMGD